ncbi:hypothetical protein M408DRAFT_192132 [Serendipita vermifera MAFF 305830]|uniref:Uncharacterized protein n=1 Tax=Serendipita vermifera MAFF 305830 TaxID=933852 RepID=A0A0C2X258_SERVB|nr:hypothetical protein M408DRAFT_263091 [Serendipita vermifera MAFF 305830]KIM26372.1 hypothetical protein M408DRAFT_192132 [Serendipita vermifera MAFF 305830]
MQAKLITVSRSPPEIYSRSTTSVETLVQSVLKQNTFPYCSWSFYKHTASVELETSFCWFNRSTQS